MFIVYTKIVTLLTLYSCGAFTLLPILVGGFLTQLRPTVILSCQIKCAVQNSLLSCTWLLHQQHPAITQVHYSTLQTLQCVFQVVLKQWSHSPTVYTKKISDILQFPAIFYRLHIPLSLLVPLHSTNAATASSHQPHIIRLWRKKSAYYLFIHSQQGATDKLPTDYLCILPVKVSFTRWRPGLIGLQLCSSRAETSFIHKLDKIRSKRDGRTFSFVDDTNIYSPPKIWILNIKWKSKIS